MYTTIHNTALALVSVGLTRDSIAYPIYFLLVSVLPEVHTSGFCVSEVRTLSLRYKSIPLV